MDLLARIGYLVIGCGLLMVALGILTSFPQRRDRAQASQKNSQEN